MAGDPSCQAFEKPGFLEGDDVRRLWVHLVSTQSAERDSPSPLGGERAGVRGEGMLTETSVFLQRRSPLTLTLSPPRGEGIGLCTLFKLGVRSRCARRL